MLWKLPPGTEKRICTIAYRFLLRTLLLEKYVKLIDLERQADSEQIRRNILKTCFVNVTQ